MRPHGKHPLSIKKESSKSVRSVKSYEVPIKKKKKKSIELKTSFFDDAFMLI